MQKEFKRNAAIFITILSATYFSTTHADTIINNYPTAAAPAPAPVQQPMPPQQPIVVQSAPTPPGTYSTKNYDGTYSTVYTTGDKQPYIVDNPQQQQPIIQPFVYPNVQTNNVGPSGPGQVGPNRPIR